MSKITAEFRTAALRRGLLIKSAHGTINKSVAFAGAIELANLGFVVSPADLAEADQKTIVETIAQARKIMGADRDMTPIYPGFPKQVQELSTMTLLIEQILHYWTAGAFLPDYPTVARDGLAIEDMLRNARELRVVSAGAAARELTTALVTNSVAISEDDKELLRAALELHKPSLDAVVETVKNSRNGENIQNFVAALNKVGAVSRDELALALIPLASNPDVLLRIVLALFTECAPLRDGRSLDEGKDMLTHAEGNRLGNYTLAVENLADRNSRAVRMLNVPRPVRRAVVEKLGRISRGYSADTLVSRQGLWRKVMTAVHPYDFKLEPSEKRAADIIHTNVEYKTLNSLIEDAMARRDVAAAVELLAANQPGNLLRRLVSLLRLVDSTADAKALAKAVRRVGGKAALTTLISAYNGVIAANDTSARVTRVAGLNNAMVTRNDVVKVEEEHLDLVRKALKKAMKENLATKAAPTGPVAVESAQAVPLVRRDASTTDREMERGADFDLAGEGDTLRVFGHWNNNMGHSGYMDVGLVILDSNFETLAVLTWNSWAQHRDLGTYSGDKLVYPGDSAAEYFDLNLKRVRSQFPHATYAAMTIQSYSGFPISKVDMIAGAMLRSKPDSGEVFDARSVSTAFKPTTDSTQSVPLAIDLRSGKLIWIDSSNGSTASGVSSTGDATIGSIVYDELERPRLTLGELAGLWAKAHGAETVAEPVDKKALLALL